MGHHLAAGSHRKTLSNNCMLDNWKDRDEVFKILRKYFILVCISWGICGGEGVVQREVVW